MALLEAILIKVGAEVATKIYEIRLRESLARGSLQAALKRRGVPLVGTRRAEKQFDQVAKSIAENLKNLVETEARDLAPNEANAALLAVRDSFERAGIDVKSLLDADLDPLNLERQVRMGASRFLESAYLSSDGKYLFDLALRECCNYITEVALSLPEFRDQALRELLARESSILEIVKEVLERLPLGSQQHRTGPDSEFELRYRRAIARKLDVLELFGVTLSEAHKRYALEIAYISLSASTTVDPQPSGGENSSGATSDLHENRPNSTRDGVENVLASYKNLVIKGEAGSGKTTLLRWLAVNSARQSFVQPIKTLNYVIPFFLQLRRYVGQEPPAPESFLNYVVPAIAGEMPHNWVHRQLTSGRALLLVDGVDEVPEVERRAVADWLEELVETFPTCRLVVTSRPSAITDNWLARTGRQVAELQPMSPSQIELFIDHWHDAAASKNQEGGELATLRQYQEQLKTAVAASLAIRNLATTPLLCAMLCALNLDRRATLPRDRMELYRIALETLLERRDAERGVRTDIPELSLREKQLLLQDLAFWLILNRQSDCTVKFAVNRVQRKVSQLPHVSSTGEDVFHHLLRRSGVLRQPVEERVDFIHKTFQEYLAAREAIQQEDLPMLIIKAHEDEWREVVVLACGHATPQQAKELIQGLLNQGETEEHCRHLYQLLAVACLETAAELDPGVVERIRGCLQNLVPPTSMSESRALASAGELAVPYLAGFGGRNAVIVANCVRTLVLINSKSALEVLREYGGDNRRTVIRELLRGWRSFDPEQYAKEVLRESPLQGGGLSVSDQESLSAARHLKNLSDLTIEFYGNPADLSVLPELRRVRSLVLMDARIQNFGPLGEMAGLQRLCVDRCVGYPSTLESLSKLANLRTLEMTELSDGGLEFLPAADTLTSLTISGWKNLQSLAGVENAIGMTRLAIRNCRNLRAWDALRSCRHLESLELEDVCLPDLDCLPESAELASLQLSRVAVEDASGLGRLQVCQSLSIACSKLLGIGTALLNVWVGSIMFRQQSIPEDLIVPATVRTLTIDGGAIENLDFLSMSIRRLHVTNCKHLRDIARLRELSELEEVVLSGSDDLEDIACLRNLSGAKIYLDRRLYETNRGSLGPNEVYLIESTSRETTEDGYYVHKFSHENGREGTISRPGSRQMS